MVKKFRRARPSVNRHHFVRSCEAVISNDIATNVPCVSSDATIINTPIGLVGGVNPYNSSANYAGTMTFALDKLIAHSEFTTLYDQYKIKGVKVTFEYAANSTDANHFSSPAPKIIFFRDYDDIIATSMSDISQREATTARRTLRGAVSTIVKPRVKDYVELTPGASTPGATYQRRWIDCNVANLQHYGLKFAIMDWPTWNGGASASSDYMARPILRIRCEYYLAFRNVR